jgi:hypothetical protein
MVRPGRFERPTYRLDPIKREDRTGSAMSEFWRGAEEEADTFHGQVIDALRTDLLALLPESGP